jgi:hypothetical protein
MPDFVDLGCDRSLRDGQRCDQDSGKPCVLINCSCFGDDAAADEVELGVDPAWDMSVACGSFDRDEATVMEANRSVKQNAGEQTRPCSRDWVWSKDGRVKPHVRYGRTLPDKPSFCNRTPFICQSIMCQQNPVGAADSRIKFRGICVSPYGVHP